MDFMEENQMFCSKDLHILMLKINIKFFSNPPALMSGIKWINKTSIRNPLIDSDSTSIKLISTLIQRIVNGKVVTLTGQSAVLTIASLQSFHLGYYQLQIHNGGNLSSSFDFQIITSAPPDKDSNYTIEIDGLEPSTTYHFWIYSTNEKGNSTLSRNLIVQTLKVYSFIKLYTVVYICVIISNTQLRYGLTSLKSGGKSEVRPNYEGISQNYQEPNLYEGIRTEPDSSGTAMELYENTKITSGAQKADI
ncbi:hypothetical protein KUTeg_006484 [Tegillarca granosa]|uniref:Fibronectin type-III domain-containing protein n=1 Tax=Tegillarca granosa TaxID=220873 RepID=A0ABQ9FLA3_TEGGR|nr:hypothetical protein KUTeg_006484 [Tegillarca granosa]